MWSQAGQGSDGTARSSKVLTQMQFHVLKFPKNHGYFHPDAHLALNFDHRAWLTKMKSNPEIACIDVNHFDRSRLKFNWFNVPE